MSDDELSVAALALQQAVERSERRGALLAFEAALAQAPGAVFGDTAQCPLTHQFGGGLYMRGITIPAGMLVVGKIHKEAHPVFLVEGALLLMTEHGGVEELHAPVVFMAPPGVKRAAYTLAQVRWTTVHANPTETQDLTALEAEIISPSFEAYDRWRAQLAAGQTPALPPAEEN